MTNIVDTITKTCNYNGDSEVDHDQERKYKNLIASSFKHAQIKSVKKLNNKYSYAAFMLKKSEKKNYKIIELIHSTAAENVDSIEKDNLDWRLVRRAKYGYGVSFSENADYANYHSSWSGGSLRAYIICDVLVDSIEREGTCKDKKVPTSDHDTIQSLDECVYVKFDDFTIYPKYALYYEKPKDSFSKYCRRFRPY